MSLNIQKMISCGRHGRKLLPVYDRTCGWCIS